MKKIINHFVLLLALFGANVLFAQIDEQSAKSVAKKMFNSCSQNNYSSAASILAYHGSDESRLYKDTYNFSNSGEAEDVKRFCNRLKAMIEISDSYEFGAFRSRKIHGEEIKSLDVIFKSGNQKIKNKLIFIAIKNNPVIFKLD